MCSGLNPVLSFLFACLHPFVLHVPRVFCDLCLASERKSFAMYGPVFFTMGLIEEAYKLAIRIFQPLQSLLHQTTVSQTPLADSCLMRQPRRATTNVIFDRNRRQTIPAMTDESLRIFVDLFFHPNCRLITSCSHPVTSCRMRTLLGAVASHSIRSCRQRTLLGPVAVSPDWTLSPSRLIEFCRQSSY